MKLGFGHTSFVLRKISNHYINDYNVKPKIFDKICHPHLSECQLRIIDIKYPYKGPYCDLECILLTQDYHSYFPSEVVQPKDVMTLVRRLIGE